MDRNKFRKPLTGMFSRIISIIFGVVFISVWSGVDGKQKEALQAAFKCFKEGYDATKVPRSIDSMINQIDCVFSREFAKCVSTLDPLLFSNETGFNGAKLVVSFEWQHNVFAEYAGLCTDIPDHHMKQYALGSGIMEELNLKNIENDDYESCAGYVMGKCSVEAEMRMKLKSDHNLLDLTQHYFDCYKTSAAAEEKLCKAAILQHFVDWVKAYEGILNGEYGKLLRETPLHS